LESFSSAGSDLAKGEQSFVKSRQTSKTGFTDLYTNLTGFDSRFETISNVFTNEGKFNSSNTFTSVKQSNFSSKVGATQALPLDNMSKNYLTANLSGSSSPNNLPTTSSKAAPQLNPYSSLYESVSSHLSTSNIKNVELSGQDFDDSSLLSKVTTSTPAPQRSLASDLPNSSSELNSQFSVAGNLEDNKILGSEQAPQSYTNLNPYKQNSNFNSPTSPNSDGSLFSAYNNSTTGFLNKQMTSKLLASNLFFAGNAPSVLSNSFALGSADVLTSTKQATVADLQSNSSTILKQRTAVSPLLNGPREKAPDIVNSLY
jgi:hypothetical protein